MKHVAATLLDTAKGIVEYSYEGNGPTILLFKGGHCTRDTDLSHSSLIYEGYSLLTISRPGYDKTDRSTGPSTEVFADTVIEVLNHLGINKVSVIAVSAAGPTGIALAVHHPERVEKLIMESAVTAPWEAGSKRQAKMLFGPSERVFWRSVKTLLRVMPDMVIKQMLGALTTENVENFYDQLSPNDRRFIFDMLATAQSGKGFSLDINQGIPDMSKIQAPVLGMYSHKDKSVPYSQALLLQSTVPSCEIYDVKSDSHLIWIGRSAQNVWNKRLEFLKQ
ncbi:alpha/beta hydrolase [Halobacillus shinanisalinarum]|uniref:Alpha/beta hydrolase n=1 Tax=Halobacillus shinanisalinarum TaxID=2932258 RepID=A0ABY4GX18_9BACI|nr:alpha/beta hydrolase [Halobacillus shinanisalinarum]UOQ92710.1 alpha/beta hydrolase [Halobacillus shinanisalinarum]